MQIRIAQNSFASLLSRCQSVLERKSTRPILENVLIEASEGTARLSATDLRVSLTQETDCLVDRPGAISIPGRKLHEIVREMPKADITLEVKENQWITASAGKSIFHLPGTPADEYPALPDPPETYLQIEASLFRTMLEKTLFAASNDESRMYLCGVFMNVWADESGSGYLRMVATDGHRLSLIDRPMSQDLAPFREGIIIPKKGLSELKNLLEGVEDPFDLAVSEGRVFCRVGPTCLAMLLIDAAFPNYEQVIPAESAQSLRTNRGILHDALRRVSLLSDEETHSVIMETDGPVAVLTSTNPQFGDAREEVETAYEGEPFKVAFNAGYFLDALRAMEGDEVLLSVTDSMAPCLLRSDTDTGLLCVIMPMRID